MEETFVRCHEMDSFVWSCRVSARIRFLFVKPKTLLLSCERNNYPRELNVLRTSLQLRFVWLRFTMGQPAALCIKVIQYRDTVTAASLLRTVWLSPFSYDLESCNENLTSYCIMTLYSNLNIKIKAFIFFNPVKYPNLYIQ